MAAGGVRQARSDPEVSVDTTFSRFRWVLAILDANDSDTNGGDMSDRLEREIEEILDKFEQFPGPAERQKRARRRLLRRFGSAIAAQQRAIASQLGRISVSQIMLASLLIVFGALFFRRLGPMVQWVLWAGVALFVASFAIMLFSRRPPSRRRRPERWRGRAIEPAPQQYPTLLEQIKVWWLRRRRRH